MLSDNKTQQTGEIGLLDLLVAIAESWIVIVLVPLIVTGGAYFVLRNAETYTASTLLDVAPARIRPVLEESFRNVSVVSTDDTMSRISVTANTSAEAQRNMESVIASLANAPYLSVADTAAEVAAVAVWSEEASLLRQSLNRVEASHETSVASDPGSYASAVSLLMNELAIREHKLRNSEIRLSRKLVVSPEAARISVSSTSSFGLKTALAVGLGVGLIVVLVVLLRKTLLRTDPQAQVKFARIRRAFFIPTKKVEERSDDSSHGNVG